MPKNLALPKDPVDPGGIHSHYLRVELPGDRVPLGFTEDAEYVYLVAKSRSAGWPIQVLREGVATLDTPHGRIRGAAELVIERGDQDRILALFREQYGPRDFARYYDSPARVLRVRRTPGSAVDPDHYFRWIEAEFDAIAEDYDHHITGNRMNRLLRDRSLAALAEMFPSPARLIEVGCGSGMETIPMLRRGHEMVAVDISEKMLDVVRRKAREEGRSEQVHLVHLRARDVGQLPRNLVGTGLDGGYSTYGSLNCEPELAPVAVGLAEILRPGARFLAGIYNRWCLFEMAAYLLTFRGERALGRRHRPVPVGLSRFCVDTFAYSVGDVTRAFAPAFSCTRAEAVPLLLPPSDLVGYADRFGRHFDRLARWDAALGRFPPLAGWGDHFLLRLQRNNGLGGPA